MPASTPRLGAIDIARGFAILWVVAYHLWTDLRFPDVYPEQSQAFREVLVQLGDRDLPGAMAAGIEAFLRAGYLGVPLFMLLSGVSLTISAMQPDAPRSTTRAIPRRLRRLLVPYWAGFAIAVAFAVALATVQWQRHGGDALGHYIRNGDINVDNDQLLAGLFLVPRIFANDLQFAPEGSLWFVLVVVQYYVVFPALLVVMRRFGPARLVAGALVVTLAANLAMVAAAGDLSRHRSWVEMGAPFRIVEFAAGMAIGLALAHGRSLTAARAITMAALGASAFVAGCLVGPDDGYVAAFGMPLVACGLALMVAPFLLERPLVASMAARALAWVGVMSYTVLIVNEPLRSITHTMRAENASTAWLAFWVIALFLPLTFILARPLGAILGLLPRGERGDWQTRDVVPAPLPRAEAVERV